VLLDILRWWLVVELVGLVGLPLCFALFRRLPDSGYGLAKPLGLLLVSYFAWLVSMLGFASLGLLALVGSAIAVAALGWYARDRARLPFRATFRRVLPAVLVQEALFAVMLGIGLLLRWRGIYGAQINHTETPMDFAFLNGILASQDFPPQDPWLAQYPINYYYFGYVMVAALTRLSGLPGAATFNLAAATIYALAATGVASLVWNLIALERERSGLTRVEGRRTFLGRLLCSLLAVVLVLIAGNQVAALQWITGSERVVALRGSEIVTALSQAGQPSITLPEPLPQMPWDQQWGGQSSLPVSENRREAVSNWWPSRAVWDDLRDSNGETYRIYTITEFPFFSFLLGDLHPHVLALPWTLLAVTLALNLLTRQSAPEWIRSGLGRVELFVTGVALGGLYAINSWDLPTYVLLFLGALLLLYARLAPERGRIFWPHLLQQAGVLVVVCYVAWLPFHMTFVPLVGADGSPIGLSPVRTPLVQFVIVFGLFAVPLIALLFQARGAEPSAIPYERAIVLAIGVGLLLIGVALNFALLFLLPLAYWAILGAYRQAEHPARSFALWVIALGALVIYGTELIYLRDVFEGQTPRMNTLFKFYYQVWLLWGMLAGYALWVLLRRPRLQTLVWLLPFVVLFVGAMVYPVLVPARGGVDRTLDGTAYIARERPADAAAIAWILQHTPGDAVVLQAPLVDSYNPAHAGIAMATGRPTLIGWRGHQEQWRGGQPEVREILGRRVEDARTIYTTTDDTLALELLRQYGVAYVYVGPQERDYVASQNAPQEALEKFNRIAELVWSGEGASIYRVP
jgi:YYY domain-containing protein